MSKSRGILDDLKDLAVVIIGAGVLCAILILWVVVTVILAYWYVVLPVAGYLAYRYLNRPAKPTQPKESTITTYETHKTATGSKTIHTVQKY